MRGKEAYFTLALAVEGITPADAGKSDQYGDSWVFVRDHPRRCGEKPI